LREGITGLVPGTTTFDAERSVKPGVLKL